MSNVNNAYFCVILYGKYHDRLIHWHTAQHRLAVLHLAFLVLPLEEIAIRVLGSNSWV